MSDFDVIIKDDVLAKDAEDVWEDASERLLEMKNARPTFPASSFGFPFEPHELHASYGRWMDAMEDYLNKGSAEFLTFEKRLLESLIAYGQAHSWSQERIAGLNGEIDV